jgi:hypothetical protein
MEDTIALAVAAALGWFGAFQLREVRQAKETGILEFIFQWPAYPTRDENPTGFAAAIFLHTLFGVVTCTIAGAILTVVVIKHIALISTLFR